MSDFEKKISVIVPIFNGEKYIHSCMENLLSQTISKNELEIVLVDDGSRDATPEICREYAEKYPFVKTVTVPNGGCAQARNVGLELVTGKYIAYLDVDDSLTKNTLKAIVKFFDKHYDETDLVTYKVVPVENGKKKPVHYRYDILRKSGIYDLNKPENYYISQTHINVAVKNMGDENILFDTTPNYCNEDQLYCTEIIRKKMTVGYVKGCEYLMENNALGVSNSSYPFELYNSSMSKWEELFASYRDNIPPYVQALFLNNIQWKMQADVLLPYQYEGDAFNIALDRILRLLKRVDDSLIINHPCCAQMNKFYFINLKYNGEITFENVDMLYLKHGDSVIYESDEIDIVIDRFKLKGDRLEIFGHLSSPVFMYSDKPELALRTRSDISSVELYESSFCRDCAKEVNNMAWGFRLELDTSRDITVAFNVQLGGKRIGTKIISGKWVPSEPELGRNRVVIGTAECLFTEKRIVISHTDEKAEKKYRLQTALKMLSKSLEVFLIRMLNLVLPKKRIWIYTDCGTDTADNAYYQFCHDFSENDGIKRFYIYKGDFSEVKTFFTREQQRRLVKSRSLKHKLLYLACEKLITSYIEEINYLPFLNGSYKYFNDLFTGEIIYLQHGVHHEHMPWKFAYERINAHREVVSTVFEAENLTKNYGFPENALIKSKMPRYDLLNTETKPRNRIVFAPSWRKYLIAQRRNGGWVKTTEKLMRSEYFIKTTELLNSKKLHKLLEENDWYLDVKLHPVFSVYKECFNLESDRIRFTDSIDPAEYKLCVTDYSSFVYDFVYLNRGVVYFMPDLKEFRMGLNDYKELDLPFEKGFGEFTQTANETVKALERIIKNDGKPLPPFAERYSDFFFSSEKSCMDEIYNALKN